MLGGHQSFQPSAVSLKLVAYCVEITHMDSPFLKSPKGRGRESDLRTGD